MIELALTIAAKEVEAVEVVPADLARELYEALLLVPRHHRTRSMWNALIRYEREVGEQEGRE